MTPQVILAGAPKCGSTSLFYYLKDHPAICAANKQETYFLIDQGYPLFQAELNFAKHGYAGYESLFSHCTADCAALRFETTPDYLYQKTPLDVIPTWSEPPKVLFVLRKPEDRVYSLFQFAKNNLGLIHSSITFGHFVEAIRPPVDDWLVDRPILASAIDHSRYANYLDRWSSVIGRDSIGIFLMEDLAKNPKEVMFEISQFLDMDPGFYSSYDFRQSNSTYHVKQQRMHQVSRKMARYFGDGRLRQLLGRMYRSLNISPAKQKNQADKEQIEGLRAEFFESDDRLKNHFGVDLIGWGR